VQGNTLDLWHNVIKRFERYNPPKEATVRIPDSLPDSGRVRTGPVGVGAPRAALLVTDTAVSADSRQT